MRVRSSACWEFGRTSGGKGKDGPDNSVSAVIESRAGSQASALIQMGRMGKDGAAIAEA